MQPQTIAVNHRDVAPLSLQPPQYGLYTFITDRPGQVTGQGVQNFFVATPGIAPLSGTSAPTGTVPASGGY
jgi:hypothetical protein